MSLFPLLSFLVVGVLCGAFVWRHSGKWLYYRSANSTIRPPHLSPGQYETQVMRRRKLVRLAKTGAAVAAGGTAGWLAATMLGAGLRGG
jgi:hypothetical protein